MVVLLRLAALRAPDADESCDGDVADNVLRTSSTTATIAPGLYVVSEPIVSRIGLRSCLHVSNKTKQKAQLSLGYTLPTKSSI